MNVLGFAVIAAFALVLTALVIKRGAELKAQKAEKVKVTV